MNKEKPLYDIPILLVFFNRYETFSKVFESIQRIKPTRLFLYQDGPRDERDVIGIQKCRDVIKQIDWECDIQTFFQKENIGCDPSGFIAQNWFFANVEYGIVLEDDCVPNNSFFLYCKEVLLKYKDDDRIALVSGFNLLDKFSDQHNPGSYFFTSHGGIWGWASWSRFYKLCDPTYSWLQDKEAIKKIKKNFSSRIEADQFIKLAKERKKEDKPYFETIVYAAARYHGMLETVPCVNLISNIGFGPSGTHSNLNFKKIPPKTRSLFNKQTYEIESPIVHPTNFSRNKVYEKKIEPKWYDSFVRLFYKIFG